MALQECKECKGQISSKAKKCPHCGAKIRSSAWGIALGFIFVSLVSVLIIVPFYQGLSSKLYTNAEVNVFPEDSSQINSIGPIVKGFYLGMNINDAAKLLNEKYRDDLLVDHLLVDDLLLEGSFLVIVDEDIAPAPDDVPIKVGGTEYLYDHFVSYNNEIFYPHPLLRFRIGLDNTIDIHADDNGLVDRIHFGKNVVNMLFNVADMDGEEFAQAFVNNYPIPRLDVRFGIISKIQDEYGYIWEYTSNQGFKVTINSKKEFWLEKVPAKNERMFD